MLDEFLYHNHRIFSRKVVLVFYIYEFRIFLHKIFDIEKLLKTRKFFLTTSYVHNIIIITLKSF